MFDFEARDSQGKTAALRRLTDLVAVGAEKQKQVIQQALKRTIVDKLVDPENMVLVSHADHIRMRYGDAEKTVAITDHALGQMCGVTHVPKTYVNKLLSECVGMPQDVRLELLTHIFNRHFYRGIYLDKKGQKTKFLHRLMDNRLYGFLSRNYNRKLGTAAMMRPFLEQCAIHRAQPVEAESDALKTSLKCVLPVVFEPVDGQFVAFGATYTNSDFGSGSLLVRGVVLRIQAGTSVVLENKLRKIHLGAMITDAEIELSEETMLRESQTHMSAVRDMVNAIFNKDAIKNTLEVVRIAASHKLDWARLINRSKEVLNESERELLGQMLGMTKSGIVDLPPVTLNDAGDPEANKWWAAAAVGSIATGVKDLTRKLSIQELAGDLLK